MIKFPKCGDEGKITISNSDDECPASLCFVNGADTFYFYYPIYDEEAVPGTILTARKGEKIYVFMRVSNDEPPTWRITSIKDLNGFHTDHGERAANDLFGKILSRDKNETYYAPIKMNYNGFMLKAHKSNVEKKILEFLSNLKNVETEDELRELVWDFKYNSTVHEWIASPVDYIEKESALNDYEETDFDGLPQINDIGTVTDIGNKKFSFKTEQGRLHLFFLISNENNGKTEQIEAKRGHWLYTFNRIKDTDNWQIVYKTRVSWL